MLQKIGFKEVISAVKTNIYENAGITCYDTVPENISGPYCYIRRGDKNSKAVRPMVVEKCSLEICIVPGNGDGEDLYTILKKVEESMTIEIPLPEGVELLLQEEIGQTLSCGDGQTVCRAELVYEFKVVYPLTEKV